MNEVIRQGLAMVRSEADEFIQRAEIAYATQRKRCLDLEDEHRKRRTATEVEWARKVSDLANEGADAIRLLDAQHAAALANERAKLETIGRLRR